MYIRGYTLSILNLIPFAMKLWQFSHYFIWMSKVIVSCNSSDFLIDLMDKMPI